MPEDENLFASNRKALRDYEIIEVVEAGLVLAGTEIKSIRRRDVSLDDSFARIDGPEAFLYNMHVGPYAQGGRFNLEPRRERKLLLHRSEIRRLHGLLTQKGLTLVPLRLYLKHGFAKVALAVGKGRRQYEKRDVIRKRESDREIRRMMRKHQ